MLLLPVLWALALPALASPIDDRASRFSFYDMPTALAGPCDLCTGPDGAVWGEDILANLIFRIDPSSGRVDEFPIPYPSSPLPLPLSALPGNSTFLDRGAFSCAIRPGADGHIYASNGLRNQLVRIDPVSKAIRIFTPPPGNPFGDLQPFNDMYSDADGMFVTQTTADIVSYFHYASETFSSFACPSPDCSPLGMFVARDGLAYFAELVGDRIGVINRTSGNVGEYPLPKKGLGPAVIRVQTEDGAIWFTCVAGNAVGRLRPETGEVTLFENNFPASFPAEDTLSPDGRVWFSTFFQNFLSYVEPDTGKVVNIEQPGTVVPEPVSLPFQFVVGIHYHDGAIYFTQAAFNRVGRYQL